MHTHTPYTYTRMPEHDFTYTNAHIPTHTHSTHTHACTHTLTHPHTYMHTCTHTCTRTCTRTHTHTHTHSNKLYGHDCTTVLTLRLTKQEANHAYPLTQIIVTGFEKTLRMESARYSRNARFW